jgi:hypothetical protein
MNKSKYELPDYLGFYNAALSAYTNAVLGANALMLEYSVTATRTMLRATALAAPVVPATAAGEGSADASAVSPDSIQLELARIEATLYADDTQPRSTESSASTQAIAKLAIAEPPPAGLAIAEPAVAELLEDPLGTTASTRPSESKKARRRRGKK